MISWRVMFAVVAMFTMAIATMNALEKQERRARLQLVESWR